MRRYCVYSPTMEDYGDYPNSPPEPYACAVEVDAPTAREAKKIAVKMKEMRDWVEQQRGDKANPFTGLKVERLDNLPDYDEKEE